MYSFERILIPTDFSPAAWQAIKAGVALAKIPTSRIQLLHVYPHQLDLESRNNKHYNMLKDKIVQMAIELSEIHELDIKGEVLIGNISATIIKYIGINQIDLVLMGANSSNLDSHIGSHTTLLIESSCAPVMVIPPTIVDVEEKVV